MPNATKAAPKKAAKRTPRKAAPRKRAPRSKPTPVAQTEFVIDAHSFARAWRNMLLAVSKDETREVLCSLCLEVYEGENALRVVATDGFVLWHCWLGDGPEPELDVEPLAQHLAFDASGQLGKILTWLASPAWRDRSVVLRFEGTDTVLEADGVRLTMSHPVQMSDDPPGPAPYPNWRPIAAKAKEVTGWSAESRANAVPGVIAIAPEILARVAKIRGKDRFYAPEAIRFVPGKDTLDALSFEVHASPTIRGLVMPVRVTK